MPNLHALESGSIELRKPGPVAHHLLFSLGVIRKLFIVNSSDEPLFRTLRKVLKDERLVEVLYDRRNRVPSEPWPGQERRVRQDVDERIRQEGYAVVRVSVEIRQNNIRWSA